MFARLKIEKNQVDLLYKTIQKDYNLRKKYKQISFDEEKLDVYKNLQLLVKGKNGVVDGDELQKYVFPTGRNGDYDAFISHSHNDKEAAVILASFLTSCCGLKVFLDSYVWKSADGLLRHIDDLYCKQDDGNYNYKRRNFSTSHVHAMLSMAIMDIIDKTDCCIFIDSKHSIALHNLKNSNKAQTLSPWLFEEIFMMKSLPRHLRRHLGELKEFSKAVGVTREFAELEMVHGVDTGDFMPIDHSDLLQMEYDENGYWNLLTAYTHFMNKNQLIV